MNSWTRWLLLGLLGLLVAAAVAFLAVRTVSETIGISSESPTAGEALAPAQPPARKKPAPASDTATAPATTPVQPQSQPAPAPSGSGDDSSGEAERGDD